jgi:ankyrin repeat protein
MSSGRFVTLAVWLVPALASAGQADDRVVGAVRNRDGAALQGLLKQGVSASARTADGTTALHWAAHLSDLSAMHALVRAGGDVNAKNAFGETPLLLACTNGNAEMVGVLLTAGADPNLGLPSGETPLMRAAWVGSLDTIKQLVARGADVNARENTRGQSALMWAVSERHATAARTLVEVGADVHARTAKDTVRFNGGVSGGSFTPLLFAARVGDVESTRILLDAGAKIDDAASDGMTPLFMALVRGHVELALQLLERGANPNVDGPGFTPLHWAAGNWQADLTARSITIDGDSEWASLAGINHRKIELMRALLARGADKNARIVRTPARVGATRSGILDGLTYPELIGATPFLLAAAAGDTAAMRLLVDSGADVTLTTRERSTPLMAAAGLGRIAGEHTIPESNVLAAAKLALELGANVNETDDIGNSALHYAAFHRLNTVVQFLVDRGARLDVKNAYGENPLWASELVIQFASHGLYNVEPSSTGDLLRKLGAPAANPWYFKRLRPNDWPENPHQSVRERAPRPAQP